MQTPRCLRRDGHGRRRGQQQGEPGVLRGFGVGQNLTKSSRRVFRAARLIDRKPSIRLSGLRRRHAAGQGLGGIDDQPLFPRRKSLARVDRAQHGHKTNEPGYSIEPYLDPPGGRKKCRFPLLPKFLPPEWKIAVIEQNAARKTKRHIRQALDNTQLDSTSNTHTHLHDNVIAIPNP